MTVIKVIFAIIGIILLALVMSLVIDAVLRRRLASRVNTEFRSTSNTSKTLIVYLPGILSGGNASSVDLVDTWLRYGDVILVEYGNYRFRAPVVVRTTCRAIRRQMATGQYDTLLFIGSSMGGLLSYDAIAQLKLGDDVAIKLQLLDAPTLASDLYAFNGTTARFAPLLLKMLAFGPIWNSLNLMAKMFVPPKEANIEPGVDRAELARRVEEAKAYTISFWRDQLLYIVTHGAPQRFSLEGRVEQLDFIRSSRDDDTVRPEAYDTWAKTVVFSSKYEVDSTHVGFAERPETWRQAFDDALGRMIKV